jgi:hypothetical protein
VVDDDVTAVLSVLDARCLTYLDMKAPDRAVKVAAELEDAVRKGPDQKGMRRYHHDAGSCRQWHRPIPMSAADSTTQLARSYSSTCRACPLVSTGS